MIPSPYPGLRPFKKEESEFFFGREEQIEGLLAKLSKTRLLAVVGPSGCGKSSLVYAGMIPALEMGFIAGTGENWRVAALRPGASPMRNLAESLHRALAMPEALGPEVPVDDTAVAFMLAALRRGPSRLAEVFREARLPDDANLLVLVDQFEEIFRYRDQTETEADEADAFVELLLAPEREAEGRIYATLTMRSDFLGDCAVFRGLPEAMNDSQFLTPRLTREQRRAAIAGPAGVAGATIEPALVNRMLEDVGQIPDQLPLLQHALMRMWIKAADRQKKETLILTTELYSAIGGVSDALSMHADEIYNHFSSMQKIIAKKMFQGMIDLSESKTDTRHPVRISEVAKLSGCEPNEVIEVADAFRSLDCSFIVPRQPKSINENSIIDVIHESFLRQWEKIAEWRKDEIESNRNYKMLVENAIMWENQGCEDGFLIKYPLLGVIEKWWRENEPNEAWARRYDRNCEGHFEKASDFLRKSRAAHKRYKNQKKRKRRKTIWLLIFIIFFLSGGIISVLLLNLALMRSEEVLKKQKQIIQYKNNELRKQSQYIGDLGSNLVEFIGSDKMPADPKDRLKSAKKILSDFLEDYSNLSKNLKREIQGELEVLEKQEWKQILLNIGEDGVDKYQTVKTLEEYMDNNRSSSFLNDAKKLQETLLSPTSATPDSPHIKRDCAHIKNILNDLKLLPGQKLRKLESADMDSLDNDCMRYLHKNKAELEVYIQKERNEWHRLKRYIYGSAANYFMKRDRISAFVSKFPKGNYDKHALDELGRINETIEKIENKKGDIRHEIETLNGLDRRFIVSNDIIKDRKSGLIWNTFDSSIEYIKGMQYNSAIEYINSLNVSRYGRITNWRLPSPEELILLYHNEPPFQVSDYMKWYWTSDILVSGWQQVAYIVSNNFRTQIYSNMKRPQELWRMAHVRAVANAE